MVPRRVASEVFPGGGHVQKLASLVDLAGRSYLDFFSWQPRAAPKPEEYVLIPFGYLYVASRSNMHI